MNVCIYVVKRNLIKIKNTTTQAGILRKILHMLLNYIPNV